MCIYIRNLNIINTKKLKNLFFKEKYEHNLWVLPVRKNRKRSLCVERRAGVYNKNLETGWVIPVGISRVLHLGKIIIYKTKLRCAYFVRHKFASFVCMYFVRLKFASFVCMYFVRHKFAYFVCMYFVRHKFASFVCMFFVRPKFASFVCMYFVFCILHKRRLQ